MAKFITTTGNSFYIEQIIIKAKKSLTLVTPYLNMSQNLFNRLCDSDKNDVRITLIYGKSKLSKSEKKKLESLNNLEIFFCENLHAKCYHNESEMVISSMNLYEFSERNNREMGLLITKNTDSSIFIDALQEIESIKNASSKEKFSMQKDISQGPVKIDSRIQPDFYEKNNFYLPALKEILLKKYPDTLIQLDKYITLKDFPNRGINLVINGRIDFKFDSSLYFKKFKTEYKSIIDKALLNYRVYWNNNQINIYNEKDFSFDLDENGLVENVNRSSVAIDTFYEILAKDN